MRRAAIAAVAPLLVGAAIVLASTGATAQEEAPAPPPPPACTPIKQVFSEKRWREAHPARGFIVCPSPNARKIIAHFRLYRRYRQIAPYRCLRGPEGYFAIPCSIIACESGFNWWAMNPSGASYIYQLLGWGAPPPTSFRNRVKNHEIAASLSLSNWVCS